MRKEKSKFVVHVLITLVEAAFFAARDGISSSLSEKSTMKASSSLELAVLLLAGFLLPDCLLTKLRNENKSS